jgi:hypothetical protein
MSLTFRGQSLQDTDDARTSRWYFDIIEGIPGHEQPQVRGEDVTAPGKQGQYEGNRVFDRQEILLEGFISGVGADAAERRQDWHLNSETILAQFAMDLSPGSLVAAAGSNDYLGLESTFTIQVRTIDLMAGPIQNAMSFQRWSIRLECIDGVWWDAGS